MIEATDTEQDDDYDLSVIDADDLKHCWLKLKTTVNVRDEHDSSTFIRRYKGKIKAGDISKTVGKFSAMVIDLDDAYYEGHAPWRVLDDHSAELSHFMPLVNRGGLKPSIAKMAGVDLCQLIAIDNVWVAEEHRGHGVGARAIEIACGSIGRYSSLAMLYAFPTQWEGRVDEDPRKFERDRAKLIRYYQAAGFVKTRFTGLMVKSLSTY